eukprot:scaffold256_cov261-Pinguiococcus_pyrenoidosus.AAC.37
MSPIVQTDDHFISARWSFSLLRSLRVLSSWRCARLAVPGAEEEDPGVVRDDAFDDVWRLRVLVRLDIDGSKASTAYARGTMPRCIRCFTALAAEASCFSCGSAPLALGILTTDLPNRPLMMAHRTRSSVNSRSNSVDELLASRMLALFASRS